MFVMLPHAVRGLAAMLAMIAFAIGAISAAGAVDMPTDARFVVLMDGETGEILFEKNGHERMAPASMSKLMTAAMVFEALKSGRIGLDDKFKVSEAAWRMQGSKMWTELGNEIRVEDLLRGMIIQSGNDACVVLAEGLAGSETGFADLMNERAKEIGLKDSTFRNSTGWPDPEHLMSAYDLAVIARHIIMTYPEYYHFYSEREYTYHGIRQYNRNRLLGSDLGVDGLKTGHTEESGYGLVSSAERDGRRLILVVNGLSSEDAREAESRRLLQFGFREFERYDLFQPGALVGTAQVFGGSADAVGLVVQDKVSRILNRAARKSMKVSLTYSAPLAAPVAAGTQVGELTVSVPGAPESKVPVYTAAGVSRMGPLGAMSLAVQSIVRGAFGGTLPGETSAAGEAAAPGATGSATPGP